MYTHRQLAEAWLLVKPGTKKVAKIFWAPKTKKVKKKKNLRRLWGSEDIEDKMQPDIMVEPQTLVGDTQG